MHRQNPQSVPGRCRVAAAQLYSYRRALTLTVYCRLWRYPQARKPGAHSSVVSAILKKNAQVMFANLAAQNIVVLTVHAQGPAEPQQDVSILYSSRSTVVEGCTVLIIAVPHYRCDDNFTVTKSPVVRSSRLVSMLS